MPSERINKKTKRRFGYTELAFYAVFLVGISYAMMYVLCREYLGVCGAIMSAVTIGVAALFYVLRLHKVMSAAAALIISFGCIGLLNSVPYWGDESFMDFVFMSSSFFNPYYAAVAIISFGSLIGFVVCYFAAYSPRPCFMMLPAFIPLILSARTAGGLPEWILVIMLSGLVMSLAGIGRPVPPECQIVVDKAAIRQRRIAIAILGAAAALLLAVVPRSSRTVYGDKLDEVFGGQRGGYYMGTPQLTNFLSNSSVNRGANSPAGNLLFTIRGSNPVYINRWSYDIYSGSEGWTTDDSYDTGYADWEKRYRSSNPAALVYRLKSAAAEGKLTEYADIINGIPYSRMGETPIMSEVFSAGKYAQIQVMDGSSTKVVLHPETTYGVTQLSGLKTYRTERGEIFTETDMPENSAYTLSYYADEPNEGLIRALETTDLQVLLLAAKDEGVLTVDEYTAYIQSERRAEKYRQITGTDGVTEKVAQLAAEITEGLTSDYDKALAIERWFGEQGFLYDMDFVPASTDVDYFLTKSRRGICSDFATATTLLARAAGLTARYDEGYFISESTLRENGAYYVTDEQAHAYTSVYITGCGWLTIDATGFVAKAEDSGALKVWFTVFVVIMAVLAVLLLIFRDRVADLIFAAVYRLRKPEGRVRAVYCRTRALACSISGKPRASTSVGEVCSVVKNALGMPQEAERLGKACDELFYGSGKVTEDTMALYRDYRAVKRRKRGLRK